MKASGRKFRSGRAFCPPHGKFLSHEPHLNLWHGVPTAEPEGAAEKRRRSRVACPLSRAGVASTPYYSEDGRWRQHDSPACTIRQGILDWNPNCRHAFVDDRAPVAPVARWYASVDACGHWQRTTALSSPRLSRHLSQMAALVPGTEEQAQMSKKIVAIVSICIAYLLLAASPAQAQTPDDSCEFANDGNCDEPGVCARWTDSTDCGTSMIQNGDPEEVENRLDLSRTESRRIRRNLRQLGYDVTEGGSLDSRNVRRAIRNWQRETGHAPTGYLTRDTADALLSIVVDPDPNSCRYAHDGTCDEPDLCSPGTDTSDCRTAPPPPPTLYCCNPYTGIRVCPIVMPGMMVGQPCICVGIYGTGLVCP